MHVRRNRRRVVERADTSLAASGTRRRLALPAPIAKWSLTSVQQRLGKEWRTAHPTCALLLVAVGRGASDPAVVCRHAAKDRGAAVAGGIRRAQRGANFDDDAGAQAEVSENSVGESAVSGILCQREAEPVCCGAGEGPSRSKPGSTFAFANRIVLVRV